MCIACLSAYVYAMSVCLCVCHVCLLMCITCLSAYVHAMSVCLTQVSKGAVRDTPLAQSYWSTGWVTVEALKCICVAPHPHPPSHRGNAC